MRFEIFTKTTIVDCSDCKDDDESVSLPFFRPFDILGETQLKKPFDGFACQLCVLLCRSILKFYISETRCCA